MDNKDTRIHLKSAMDNLFIGEFTDADKSRMCNPSTQRKARLKAQIENNNEYLERKKEGKTRVNKPRL